MDRIILFILLAVFSIMICGCNTLKKAGEGAASMMISGCNAFKKVSQGAKEDWEVLKKWDKEFQEKYW